MKRLRVDDFELYEKGSEWLKKQLIKKGFDLNKPIKKVRHTIADVTDYTQKD